MLGAGLEIGVTICPTQASPLYQVRIFLMINTACPSDRNTSKCRLPIWRSIPIPRYYLPSGFYVNDMLTLHSLLRYFNVVHSDSHTDDSLNVLNTISLLACLLFSTDIQKSLLNWQFIWHARDLQSLYLSLSSY